LEEGSVGDGREMGWKRKRDVVEIKMDGVEIKERWSGDKRGMEWIWKSD
jgi:hypothetical protein